MGSKTTRTLIYHQLDYHQLDSMASAAIGVGGEVSWLVGTALSGINRAFEKPPNLRLALYAYVCKEDFLTELCEHRERLVDRMVPRLTKWWEVLVEHRRWTCWVCWGLSGMLYC